MAAHLTRNVSEGF